TTSRASTPTTSANRCSRPLRARCARRWRSTRARPPPFPRPRAPCELRDAPALVSTAMNMQVNPVAVVDYGMGNLRSVSQAVMTAAQGTGWQVVVTSDPEAVRAADRVVLPGQGAIPDCMRELRSSGLLDSVLEA